MKYGVVLFALVLVSSFLFLNGNRISAHADQDCDQFNTRACSYVYFCSNDPFKEELEKDEFADYYLHSTDFFLNIPPDQEQAKQDLLASKWYEDGFDNLGQNIQCLKVNGIDYRTITPGEINYGSIDQLDICKYYPGYHCDNSKPVVTNHIEVWNAVKEIAKENPEWFLIHAPNLGLSAFDLDYCKMNPDLLNSVLVSKISQINYYSDKVIKGNLLENIISNNTLVAGEIAKCHTENNIKLEIPDLSPTAKSRLLAEEDNVQKFAPNFDRYILNAQNSSSTPEFGPLAGIIIAISIIGVIVISRKFGFHF